jgi:hypothetical protein
VPHPFAFFLAKGWEANEFWVYTISENALETMRGGSVPDSGCGQGKQELASLSMLALSPDAAAMLLNDAAA